MSRHLLVALTLTAAAAGCKAQVRASATTTPREPVAERRQHRPSPAQVEQARPPVAAPDYAAQGWILLGEKWVEGRNDRDTISVGGRKQGTWTKLMLAVEGSDMKLNDLTVTFGNGTKQSPKLRHIFREGSRSAPIDLSGQDRAIDAIDLRYSDLDARDGRAKVQLWGRAGDGDPTVANRSENGKPGKASWNSSGWDKLGEQKVNGKKDHVTFKPDAKKGGSYTKLMVVVDDSELDMSDVVVTFANKEKVTIDVEHAFKEGDRTRAIDLPNNSSKIQKIEFKSSNVPGGAKGRIELWGKG